MTSWPGHIVVVGGGTAGWLAAMMLTDAARRAGQASRVTVIESSRLGTIGVGEGTTAVFRQMLKHFGIDELEFLRETGATIKYGIRHRDWRRLGHHYDGPIDDPHLLTPGLPLHTYAVAAGRPVGEAHLFQALIDARRAPFASREGRLIPAGPFHHAYHFDQALAGAFLKRRARGVTLIDDQVAGVETGEAGIAALTLESGQRIEGDFFLDCTGFRRALVGALGADWISYADVLPVNRAMPFWLDLAEGEEIDPVTLAWAQGAGWMWRIPTQGRLGCGYVYSDAHTTPEAAQREIEAALGRPIEPRRDIRIDAGRLRDAWRGNCVALGLSSSFLEPLEATSIHGTVVQLMMLTDWLGDPAAPARYNAAVARQVDDFRDFIRLHYVSERRDTPFWRDVAASHPPEVTDRLALWQTRLPERADFAPFPLGLAHVEEQLYRPVLDGLGLLDRKVAQAAMASDTARRDRTRAAHGTLVRDYRQAAARCLPHRHFLKSLTTETAA
ncbi:tryptophan halogenase family protein [Histidinibacterium lentulum]|uniref:Tryptophan 7-halogenase n=1 Tax=Histidinibacterium lentulum TaxID=2480588 RepID=A0A3N2R7X7_9RHOB|nr:tryptophan halogenase family protein [Histidinibacterium lentulum]ROU03481.1 tryptophan 7-halogenase [Histidinibacterium lentulum]